MAAKFYTYHAYPGIDFHGKLVGVQTPTLPKLKFSNIFTPYRNTKILGVFPYKFQTITSSKVGSHTDSYQRLYIEFRG